MPRLLVINYAFPPFGGAPSRRVTKLVKYLDREGWQTAVITAPRIVNALWDPESARDLPSSTVVIRTFSLEPVPPAGRSWPWLLGLRRIMNIPCIPNIAMLWALPAILPAVRAARKYQAEAVLCSGPEFPAFVAGAVVKKIMGLPLLLDYRDEWTTHPLKLEMDKRSALHHLKFKGERALERRLAHFADGVIANTPGFKQMFVEELNLSPARTHVVPNGFDPEDFASAGQERPSDALPSSGPASPEPATTKPFTVTHLGGFRPNSLRRSPPYELLHALDRVCARTGRAAELRILGNLHPEERARLASQAFSSLRVEVTGFLPAPVALAKLQEGDLNLLFIDRIPGIERYYNAKLFDYFGSGKPLLVYGPRSGVIGEAAQKSGLGQVIEWDELSELESCFCRWLEGGLSPQPAPEYINNFSWPGLARRVADLLNDLTAGPRAPD